MQIPDPDGARFDRLKSCPFEQSHDLGGIDMTVPVEVPRKAAPSRLGLAEINEEYTAARPDDSAQLRCKIPTRGAAEVVQHHRSDPQIETRIRKRKQLSGGILEAHFDSSLCRLRARPGQHFDRRIHPADRSGPANDLFRANRERAGSAPDIEHRLARPQARQVEQPLAQLPLAPAQEEPNDRIVEHRRVQDRSQGPLLRTPGRRILDRHGPSSKMDICSIRSVGSQPMAAEERKRRIVRYRTTTATLSGRAPEDRRIQRTHALLHEALGSLIREKAYDRITVAQILNRAGVSRSTFYIHFRDKDDLLTSGMRALLFGVLATDGAAPADTADRMVGFCLPLLSHIHQHRRSARAKLGERGRAILHAHLRSVLAEWILQALAGNHQRPLPLSGRSSVAPELLAHHIASTFVLVLHWWLDHDAATAPAEADRLFRALVMPVLRSATGS